VAAAVPQDLEDRGRAGLVAGDRAEQDEHAVRVVRVPGGEPFERFDALLEHGGHECGPVGEVAVERRLADAGGARHLVHRDRAAAFGQQPLGGVEDRAA
jgi:hypothetical protein